MSSWGNHDNAANAPYWAVNSTVAKNNSHRARSTAANVALLYGNTTPSVYTTDKTIGLFLVDTTEEFAGSDNITDVSVGNAGSGYVEAPGVSFSGGGGTGAAASATISGGKVTKILITNVGSSYETVPTVTVQVPVLSFGTAAVNTTTETITYNSHSQANGAALIYNNAGGTTLGGLTSGNTYYVGQKTTNTFKLYDTAVHGATAVATLTVSSASVNTSTSIITSASHGLINGAQVNYNNQGGTTITGLTNGNDYFIVNATANTFQLADTLNGTPKTITGAGNNAQTFASSGNLNLTGTGNNGQYFIIGAGVRATAIADKGLGSQDGVNSSFTHAPHVGWNLKNVGTGGRAGRVQWETLVVLANPIGDGSDNLTLPNS
jgi:hypothetical protein